MKARIFGASLIAVVALAAAACTAHAASTDTTGAAASSSDAAAAAPTAARTSAVAGASSGSSDSPTRTAAPPTSGTTHRPAPTTATTTRLATPAASRPRTTLTTESAIWTSATADGAGPIPTCGYPDTAQYPTDPTVTPAPNACSFGGASPSPFCLTPRAIVSGGVTQTPATVVEPPGASDAVLTPQGAHGYMCTNANSDGSVSMSDGQKAFVVEPDDDPIVYAGRVDLARSSGVWGIARRDVASVEVVDAARPDGVLANLQLIPGGDLRLFIAPVSSSPVTITALDESGHQLAHTTVPPCC